MNHNYQSLSDNNVTLKVEDFVEVEYNKYAGEVKLIEEDVQVSVLHRHFSQNGKWPAPPLFLKQIFQCVKKIGHTGTCWYRGKI